MYYIAPLLFWACAEMTCGFFIFCVPCIPSIIKDVRLPSKITNILGFSLKFSNNPSNIYSHTTSQATYKMHKIESAHAYYYVDDHDGALPLSARGLSEPQEHLRAQENADWGVTRTTHTIVTSDLRCVQSDSDVGNNVTLWIREANAGSQIWRK